MLPPQVVCIHSDFSAVAAFLHTQCYTQIGVIVDEHTKKHCYPWVQKFLPAHHLICINSGEINKNFNTCTLIWQNLTALQFDRHALLINLGGGVICDLGGFCAATYKRGIDFVHMPTTLLAQADACIGGKVGVNFLNFKNQIGVFKAPVKIFIIPNFLKTLPKRVLQAGFFEMVKHALIADKVYWSCVSTLDLSQKDWTALITKSMAIKYQIVQQDPTEQGIRKILNFGHTIGHAVEHYFLHTQTKNLLHGEAIAVGMICEAYISMKQTGLSASALAAIVHLLYPPIHWVQFNIAAVYTALAQDKKNFGRHKRFSLLHAIGKSQYSVPIDEALVKEALIYYHQLASDN